jgi:RNA polymerase sigma factor (sigma-70 family)
MARTSARTPDDWKELLCDFLVGDAGAARASADAFCGIIRGTLRALGAYERRSSWDDLMHDVLLRLFENGHGVENPVAWLRRATYNAYVDEMRRETSRALRARDLELEEARRSEAAGGLLDVSVALKEELEELRAAVSKLPDGLRRIVDCVYPRDPGREPGSLADVAKSLGVAEHTVKNRVRSAIERLGREMRRERKLRRYRMRKPPSPDAQGTRPSRPPLPEGLRFGFLRSWESRAEE